MRAASGQDLPAFVAAELFAPAGMVAVMDPLAEPAGRARSYRRDGDGWRPVDSGWSQVGDGGIQTTPTELAAWGRQYWEPSVGGEALTVAREEGAVVDGEPFDSRYGAGVRYSQVPGMGRVVSHLVRGRPSSRRSRSHRSTSCRWPPPAPPPSWSPSGPTSPWTCCGPG